MRKMQRERLSISVVFKGTMNRVTRIVGVYACRKKNTQMKLLPGNKLTKPAIKIEQKDTKIIFMAILYEYQC